MQIIGKIDIEKYQKVTKNKIITDQVILTNTQKEHIIKRRGQDFFNKYAPFFEKIISDPDYIFKDKNNNTALAAKRICNDGSSINIVLRLAIENEDVNHKNSIITAVRENDKRFSQRLRNNMPVYGCGQIEHNMI